MKPHPIEIEAQNQKQTIKIKSIIGENDNVKLVPENISLIHY